MTSPASVFTHIASGKVKRAYWISGDEYYKEFLTSALEGVFQDVHHILPEAVWEELAFQGPPRRRLVVVRQADRLFQDPSFTDKLTDWLGRKELAHVHAVFLDSLETWPKSLKSRPSEARELWVGSTFPSTTYVQATLETSSEAALQKLMDVAVAAGVGSDKHAQTLFSACAENFSQTLNAARKVGWFLRSGASPKREAMNLFGNLPLPSYAHSLLLLDKSSALAVAPISDPAKEISTLTDRLHVMGHAYDLKRANQKTPHYDFARRLGVPAYMVHDFLTASAHYGPRDVERRVHLLAEMEGLTDRRSCLTVLCSRW